MTATRRRWPPAFVGMLLLLSLLAVPIMQAGTEDDPEIEGERYTVRTIEGTPACDTDSGTCLPPAAFIDLRSGWIESETDDEVTVHMKVWGNHNANGYGAAHFEFHFTIGETEYSAGFHVNHADVEDGLPGDGAVSPTGVASDAFYGEDVMIIVIPREAIDSPESGMEMTDLFLTSELDLVAAGLITGFRDRAPEEGFGRNYVFIAGGGAEGPEAGFALASDTMEAHAHPLQIVPFEFEARLTDPENVTESVALTLNATVPEGWSFTISPTTSLALNADEPVGTATLNVQVPENAALGDHTVVARAHGPANSTASISFTVTVEEPDDEPEPTPPPAPPTAPPTGPGSGNGNGNGNGDGSGDGSTLDDYLDTLSNNLGYLAISAGLLAAVLVLCIIGLAGRWKA